jgi:hypothetical protein
LTAVEDAPGMGDRVVVAGISQAMIRPTAGEGSSLRIRALVSAARKSEPVTQIRPSRGPIRRATARASAGSAVTWAGRPSISRIACATS